MDVYAENKCAMDGSLSEIEGDISDSYIQTFTVS